MFRFSFKARLINRFCCELFHLGSDELKHLMKAALRNLSTENHQFSLFEDKRLFKAALER